MIFFPILIENLQIMDQYYLHNDISICILMTKYYEITIWGFLMFIVSDARD